MLRRWPLPLVLLAALLAAAGCGDSEDPAAPGVTADACAELVPQCLVNQMACEIVGGSPACTTCPSGQHASPEGACVALQGTPTSHEFSEFTTEPGQEVLGLCQSWTLNNAQEIWVNAVELVQTEASHHSNWTFVPNTEYEGPDGVWPCEERNYSQLTAALSGGVLYAQSTQAVKEVQKFPDGAAVRIPPYSRIIGDVHLLNASAEPVTGTVTITYYELEKSAVEVKLVPFHMTYDGLAIPPKSSSRFTGECNLVDGFQSFANEPFDIDLYYVLPHTHALGKRFFFEVYGGERDGESLLDIVGFNGEARGRAFDPPIDLAGTDGFRFGCEFQNPRDEEVGWGFGDQEMCEMLGFAHSPAAFESSVEEAIADGEDGGTKLFTGACSTLVVPWDHEKAGGEPP